MLILVMGGSGLIGRAFCREMLAAGHRLCVLTRRPGRLSLPEGVEQRVYDGRTTDGWQDFVDQADAIVNLVGENIGGGLWTDERKRRILESRVNSVRLVNEAVAAARRKPEVVMQASAVGYYGDVPDGQVDEQGLPGRDLIAQVAVQWEQAGEPLETLGVRRVVVRTGLVLDAHEGILTRFLLPVRLFAGGPIGSGKQGVSWIHVQDQVRAMRFLIENASARGVYNLTAPGPVSNSTFVRVLARQVGRPYWLPAPAFALRLAFGEMSSLLLSGQYVVPARLTAEGFQFNFSSLDDALRDLLS